MPWPVPVQAPALARMPPARSSPRVCRSCTSCRGRGAGCAPARASARQLSRRATRSTGSSRPRRRPEAQTAATSGPGSMAAGVSGARWAGGGSSRLLRSGTGRKTRRGGALQGCGQVATLLPAPGAWRSTAKHGVASRHLNSTLGHRAASVAGLKSSSSSWAGPRGSEAAGACTPRPPLACDSVNMAPLCCTPPRAGQTLLGRAAACGACGCAQLSASLLLLLTGSADVAALLLPALGAPAACIGSCAGRLARSAGTARGCGAACSMAWEASRGGLASSTTSSSACGGRPYVYACMEPCTPQARARRGRRARLPAASPAALARQARLARGA